MFEIWWKLWTHKSKVNNPQAEENVKEIKPRHIIISLPKEKILETPRQKRNIMYRGTKTWWTEFSETVQARNQ